MTTLTSQVPAVTDYLIAHAAAFVPAGTQVLDGPPPARSVYAFEPTLWIGWDPAQSGPAGASETQDFAFLDHGRTRDDDGQVICTAQHWSGDSTVKVHRDACAAIVAGVELMLRGDPASGGPGDASMGGLVLWSGVTAAEWYPSQLPNGAQVRCMFRVTYRARLTT